MAASPKPVVFDTSVVSIIYNQDQRASFYEEGLEGHRAVVSFQTLEEISYWPRKNGWGDSAAKRTNATPDQWMTVIWSRPSLGSAYLRTIASQTLREFAGRRLNTGLDDMDCRNRRKVCS